MEITGHDFRYVSVDVASFWVGGPLGHATGEEPLTSLLSFVQDPLAASMLNMGGGQRGGQAPHLWQHKHHPMSDKPTYDYEGVFKGGAAGSYRHKL